MMTRTDSPGCASELGMYDEEGTILGVAGK